MKSKQRMSGDIHRISAQCEKEKWKNKIYHSEEEQGSMTRGKLFTYSVLQHSQL